MSQINRFNATTGSLKTLYPCGWTAQEARSSRVRSPFVSQRRIQGRDNAQLRLKDYNMHSLNQTKQLITKERWNQFIQPLSLSSSRRSDTVDLVKIYLQLCWKMDEWTITLVLSVSQEHVSLKSWWRRRICIQSWVPAAHSRLGPQHPACISPMKPSVAVLVWPWRAIWVFG